MSDYATRSREKKISSSPQLRIHLDATISAGVQGGGVFPSCEWNFIVSRGRKQQQNWLDSVSQVR